MRYSRVMCLVRGDASDVSVVETAVSLSSGNNRSIRFVHVIVVDRRYALDTPSPSEYSRAESILLDAEHASGLRSEARGSILQARSIGPVLVREALDFEAEAIVLSAKIFNTLSSKKIDQDSEYLLVNAPCAVVLVREGGQSFELTNDHPDRGLEDALAR